MVLLIKKKLAEQLNIVTSKGNGAGQRIKVILGTVADLKVWILKELEMFIF